MCTKRNVLGILCFFIHFIVEITSFYVITSYASLEIAAVLAFAYDLIAFVPQGLFGVIKDKWIKIDFSLIGAILTALSVLLLHFNATAVLVVIIVAIGNAVVHIDCAETTLRGSNGKMTPAALFVAGGSFGVIIGKLLAQNGFPALAIIGITLVIIPLTLITARIFNPSESESNLKSYSFSNKRFGAPTIILLAVIVVAVRAYMGYGIPTTWNKTVTQTILLYVFMGIGKALGGIFIDCIGIKKTALISTLGALPFLLFGENIMTVSLIGVMVFSMTMAITLAIIVSELSDFPGIAFGMTTIGLFAGTLPVFFFKISTILINCLIISLLTVVCVIILLMICGESKNQSATPFDYKKITK